jgi:hypothetical protein
MPANAISPAQNVIALGARAGPPECGLIPLPPSFLSRRRHDHDVADLYD